MGMLESLPTEVRKMYENEGQILRDDTHEYEQRRPFKGVKEGKYEEFIAKVKTNGMVELHSAKPKVINGVFGVPKQEKQRLIIYARNANKYFIDPPDPNLPNPGDFNELVLSEKGRLYTAKSDLDNFYHRLRLPIWLRTYFGLPPLKINGVEQYPVITTMPMGWSHSVFVAQKIHEELIRKCGVGNKKNIKSDEKLLGEFTYVAYIDDYVSFGTSKEKAELALEKIILQCEEDGVPAKESKIVRPGQNTSTVLGVEVHENSMLKPEKEKLRNLIRFTTWFDKLRVWPKKQLQIVLGR